LSRRSGGLVDADQLTEGCGEDAELRCAQNAETVGDRAEPHQPIINGSFVILRRVESVDLLGGVRCVDQCLAKALDRGVEGVLGADNGSWPLRIFRNDGSASISNEQWPSVRDGGLRVGRERRVDLDPAEKVVGHLERLSSFGSGGI